jgi:methionine synthase I (cobalamin-dependent)
VDVEEPLEVRAELTAHGTVQQEVDGRVQQGQKIQKFAHSVKADASVSGTVDKAVGWRCGILPVVAVREEMSTQDAAQQRHYPLRYFRH